ncbi:hypothetical protein MSPP1_001048 [Malassezia sp. CBS 17886]|nr:hypothetical protein MSPP1_001048 [Malassezia sp. CBS 17886]
MTPTSRIYLTRHAQAEHNVHGDNSIVDAPLTDLGILQAERMPALTPEVQDAVDLVVTSPLKRTLQTTALAYAPAIERLGGMKKVVCLPQLQGSSREELEALEYYARFDLSALTPDWIGKAGVYAVDEEALSARAQWLRQYLRGRPEQHIVVVAHGDFLRRIAEQPDTPWGNAQIRLYEFDPALVETDACPLMQVQDVTPGNWVDGDVAANGMADPLANMEERVKQIQASVASQSNELEELDRRLEEAERKKTELEAQVLDN